MEMLDDAWNPVCAWFYLVARLRVVQKIWMYWLIW